LSTAANFLEGISDRVVNFQRDFTRIGAVYLSFDEKSLM